METLNNHELQEIAFGTIVGKAALGALWEEQQDTNQTNRSLVYMKKSAVTVHNSTNF